MNNPIKPTGNRFYYLDNLCAMMVLHMIFTVHVSWSVGYRPEVIKFISTTLGCFMSWFFFKAGMMHRDGDTVSFVKKSFKRLIVPYFTFLVIGLLIDGLTSYIQQGHALNLALFARNELVTVLKNQILVPTAASWFLLSLFIVRITYHILHKKSTPPYVISIVALVLAYLVFLLQNNTFGVAPFYIPFYLGNISHGLLLYSLGNYLKEKQFNKYVMWISLAVFILHYFVPATSDFRANTSSNYLLTVIYGIAGSISFNNIFYRFLNREIPLLTHIGKNSMIYYLVHFPVIYVATAFFGGQLAAFSLPIRFVIVSLIVILSLIVAEYLFRIKKLRFMIGG